MEEMRKKKIVWVDRTLLSRPVFWSVALAMMFTCWLETEQASLMQSSDAISQRVPFASVLPG